VVVVREVDMTTSATEPGLRIGLFTDSYAPSRNGVAVAVSQLQAHLIARGHDVVVVAPRGRLAGRFTRQELLMSSVRVIGLHPPLATGWGFRRCARRFARAEFDLVHVHGFGPVSLLGIHLAKWAGIPLVVTWHTDLEAYVRHYRHLMPVLLLWAVIVRVICGRVALATPVGTSWRGRRAAAVSAAILRNADLITVPSGKTAKRVAELAGAVPVVTVPTGVDPILPTSPTVFVPWTRPVILYVGRIAPEKGVGLLLDAFLKLRADLPCATLVLVGDDTCARTLRRRLREVRQHNVRVIGEIDRGELGTYYAMADFFVFPSVTDTQGLVLHEAAHAGLPLVLVDEELAKDLATGSNVVVAAPLPAALASAMTMMAARCADQDFARRAAHDGKRYAAQFSVKRQHEELVTQYLRCVKQPVAHA
jgi:1,2-diacylglycerol 3-alpha-glucosyltransferase